MRAAVLRWREGPWYVALQTEIHRNYLPVSLTDPERRRPAGVCIAAKIKGRSNRAAFQISNLKSQISDLKFQISNSQNVDQLLNRTG